jgi:hypothetical protein
VSLNADMNFIHIEGLMNILEIPSKETMKTGGNQGLGRQEWLPVNALQLCLLSPSDHVSTDRFFSLCNFNLKL